MKEAIQKAIEGGYEPFKTISLTSADIIEKTDFETLTLFHQGTESCRASINLYRVLLDPLFWQCLGKALGWGKTKELVEEMRCESLLSVWPNEWQVYWHCFIDHLATGGDVDEFFTSLLSNNK